MKESENGGGDDPADKMEKTHHFQRKVSTRLLIKDLEAAYRHFGHPPTVREYRKVGKHSVQTYQKRFDSWASAIDAAGLGDELPDNRRVYSEPESDYPSKDEVLDDLRAGAALFGSPPKRDQYRELGTYSESRIADMFGGWVAALEAAGLEVSEKRKKQSKNASKNE